MLVVFGSAKLFAEIFEKLHQPGIVGEIIAGIIVGPSVLGWIAPSTIMSALAELGVMFLLFRVGMEVRPSELFRVGGVATIVACLGVVLPFFAGWGIMLWWGAPRIEAIFVGAAMVATSVGITAQVLASKGLLEHEATKIILAAAVIDDVLGLIVLAAVSGLAREQVHVTELVLTAVMAIAFTLIVALWGGAAVGRVLPWIEAHLRVGEVQFNIAMLLLFGLAVLATDAGVAAIIGAFLAGMIFSENSTHRVEALTHGVTELLVPFFLVDIGLYLDLRVFTDPSILLLCGLILAAALLTKLVGCGSAVANLGPLMAARVGTGMMPRGEVGMVVAQLGLTMGVIAKPIYGVVVFMAIATTLIAPPLISMTFHATGRHEAVAVHDDYELG